MGRAADRLDRIERNLRSLPEQGVRPSVQEAARAAMVEWKIDAGSDAKLSGVRNGVAQTVDVKVETRVGADYAQGYAKAGPQRQRAPWFWKNDGTKPGVRRARRTRSTGELRSRGGGNHPGTPATHVWDRATAKFVPKVRERFEQLFSKAVNG